MKKGFLILSVIVLGLVAVAGITSAADSQSFMVSAKVPLSSGITFTVTEISVNNATGVQTWTNNHPDDVNFGTLEFDSVNKIFRPTKYFAIDLGTVENGVGKPDNINFTYSDSANPNSGSARGGLGKKATLSVVEASVDENDVPQADIVVKEPVLLSQVGTIGSIAKTNFPDGWPRMYVGLYDGLGAKTGWEVFTAADAPGEYNGTLQISATVN